MATIRSDETAQLAREQEERDKRAGIAPSWTGYMDTGPKAVGVFPPGSVVVPQNNAPATFSLKSPPPDEEYRGANAIYRGGFKEAERPWYQPKSTDQVMKENEANVRRIVSDVGAGVGNAIDFLMSPQQMADAAKQIKDSLIQTPQGSAVAGALEKAKGALDTAFPSTPGTVSSTASGAVNPQAVAPASPVSGALPRRSDTEIIAETRRVLEEGGKAPVEKGPPIDRETAAGAAPVAAAGTTPATTATAAGVGPKITIDSKGRETITPSRAIQQAGIGWGGSVGAGAGIGGGRTIDQMVDLVNRRIDAQVDSILNNPRNYYSHSKSLTKNAMSLIAALRGSQHTALGQAISSKAGIEQSELAARAGITGGVLSSEAQRENARLQAETAREGHGVQMETNREARLSREALTREGIEQRREAHAETSELRKMLKENEDFQKAITHYGTDPNTGEHNQGKALFEIGFSEGLHSQRPEVQRAFAPFKVKKEALEKKKNRKLQPIELKTLKEDYYKAMGWL